MSIKLCTVQESNLQIHEALLPRFCSVSSVSNCAFQPVLGFLFVSSIRVWQQLSCNQASVVGQNCRVAKFANITDNSIEQRLNGIVEIGSNAFLQTFDSKLPAVPRLDLYNA